MNDSTESRRIEILRDSVSQKIAAGEVIERPSSIVRELIDNAVDAGADEIDVYVTGGGVQSIVVLDNGCGMTPDDLTLCYLPHATSKISVVEDLLHVTTLGFRGEALSSIAACANLSITSSVDGGRHGWQLNVRGGSHTLKETRCAAGSSVTVTDLFHDLPGRRRFLKRSATETLMCKNIFIDKAIAFPDISFRFFADGDLKTYLPVSSLKERVSAAFGKDLPLSLCSDAHERFDRFSVMLVGGDPPLSRRDRRRIYVYVNKRKINDFALVQAVSHGFSEFYPGGTFPVAAAFVEIDPDLADFNIHPAKREVRLRIAPDVHHGIVHTVRAMLSERSVSPEPRDPSQAALSFDPVARSPVRGPEPFRSTNTLKSARGDSVAEGARRLLENATGAIPVRSNDEERDFTYYGQVFGLFLLAGAGDVLYIIDQHAAHERIIFDQLMNNEPRTQQLLVPELIEMEPEEDAFLARIQNGFRESGIGLEKAGDGAWHITSLPEAAAYLKHDIATFISSFRGTEGDIRHALYETIACKTAIKDGEVLDDVTAVELIKKAFELSQPRCPHGRPVWIRLQRSELFSLVGRT